MKCPYCSSSQLRVTDKRTSNDSIRRRRECLKCKKRFTTYERIAVPNLMVIKKDGRKEKFDSEKLSRGVFKAFEKSPVPREKIEKMIREIEESIEKRERWK
jgi:transcriptional repressor NrdR